MKLLDNILDKLGQDKVLHFLIAGFLTALISPWGLLAIVIMSIVVIILSFIKEKWLDETFDTNDILAAFYGCLFTSVVNLLYLI